MVTITLRSFINKNLKFFFFFCEHQEFEQSYWWSSMKIDLSKALFEKKFSLKFPDILELLKKKSVVVVRFMQLQRGIKFFEAIPLVLKQGFSKMHIVFVKLTY